MNINNQNEIKLPIIKYNKDGLVPVVVQEVDTKEVLMLAYMNPLALEKTIEERVAYYYSRSREELWKKGETSGHIQYVKSLSYDCDQDTLLLKVKQVGVACHTNHMSCFYEDIICEDNKEKQVTLEEIYATIEERRNSPIEGSYTNYLFNKGLDKILKKVGEETAEVIIAAKNQSKTELIYEMSDLVYHSLVLMVNQGIKISDIKEELSKRRK
jgi:phosphoribosyl-AMP cyclohydrolase / phosphoribosyl-ATP pyrophosphohydrolase